MENEESDRLKQEIIKAKKNCDSLEKALIHIPIPKNNQIFTPHVSDNLAVIAMSLGFISFGMFLDRLIQNL